MSLNKEIRSVPAGADQETAITAPEYRLPGRPAQLPSTFPKVPGEKQCFSLQGQPRAQSEAVPGWNSHQMAAWLALWLGAWCLGGRVAASLQLSFCEETLCIIYRACTANLYQLSRKCLCGTKVRLQGAGRRARRIPFDGSSLTAVTLK